MKGKKENLLQKFLDNLKMHGIGAIDAMETVEQGLVEKRGTKVLVL